MKKFFAFFIAFAVVCCLAGCGAKIVSASIQPEATLAKGETLVLTPSYAAEKEASDEALAKAAEKLSPVWASDDETVATVDTDGTIHAVGAGEATVTLTAKEGVSAQCRVTVYVPLEGLRVTEKLELAVGGDEGEDEAAIEVTLTPDDATDVEFGYSSSDVRVATVDENGLVRAVGTGECKITVRAVSNTGADKTEKQAETTVVVTDKSEESVAATPARPTGNVGGANQGTGTGGNSGASSSGNGSGNQAPDPTPAPSAPDPEPQPTPPAPTVTCSYCGGAHDVSACPSHYHGNGNDAGVCPVCGRAYSVVVDPSTAPPDSWVGD